MNNSKDNINEKIEEIFKKLKEIHNLSDEIEENMNLITEILKKDEKQQLCPNCKNKMEITPMEYIEYDIIGDGATSVRNNYDENAIQCKKCKLSYAGNHIITYKGFDINCWTSNILKKWIDDVNKGKGKDVIRYD